MGYLDEIINRALQRAIQNLREKSRSHLKYKKRVTNRQILYEKKLRLGRVRN